MLGLGPRYYAAAKLDGLRAVMPTAGRRAMADLPDTLRHRTRRRSHFLLVGFDYDRERAVFFRSNAESLTSSSASASHTPLVEAVHASTNAPINYFDEPARSRPPKPASRRGASGTARSPA